MYTGNASTLVALLLNQNLHADQFTVFDNQPEELKININYLLNNVSCFYIPFYFNYTTINVTNIKL